jgi:hypothetical protein
MSQDRTNYGEHPILHRDTPANKIIKDYNERCLVPIAHSTLHATWAAKYRIPWIAEYAIAMVISCKSMTWDDITEQHISQMGRMSNTEVGPRLASIFLGLPIVPPEVLVSRLSTRNVFNELDREEVALMSGNSNMGLGDDGSVEQWWGGQVEQPAELVKMSLGSKPEFRLRLLPPECRRISNQLAREHGSRRFLRVKPFKGFLKAEEKTALAKHIRLGQILLGRVFRYFNSHDGSFRLVETCEKVGSARPFLGSKVSLPNFVESFNPILSVPNHIQVR